MPTTSSKTSNTKITVNGEEHTLTRRQELFCRYYVSNGKKGKEAAISAGYTKNTAKQTAYENLTKPYLNALIDKLQKPVLDKLKIDENWVLTCLKNYADANIIDFVDFEPVEVEIDGKKTKRIKQTIKDLRTVPREKLAALEWIRQIDEYTVIPKFINRQAAIINIGKHLGMFTDKVEGAGPTHIENKTLVFIIPPAKKLEDG